LCYVHIYLGDYPLAVLISKGPDAENEIKEKEKNGSALAVVLF
jgi:hypothetical protein